MKSFFTSSLDKIDALEPYVNAMAWNSYRSQFRTSQRSTSGNRNCALASGSLNPDTPALANAEGRAVDFPLILQNISNQRVAIENYRDVQSLLAVDVDACFGAGEIDFFEEKRDSWVEASWLENSDSANECPYDQELGLLESVQEIAIALARTTPNRTISKKEEAK
ncbi:MAG: hypothetical protein NTY15_12790 [Planctomycetota bacterium]|nr:hypothetical protein [Planctomycetota bacterium]